MYCIRFSEFLKTMNYISFIFQNSIFCPDVQIFPIFKNDDFPVCAIWFLLFFKIQIICTIPNFQYFEKLNLFVFMFPILWCFSKFNFPVFIFLKIPILKNIHFLFRFTKILYFLKFKFSVILFQKILILKNYYIVFSISNFKKFF